MTPPKEETKEPITIREVTKKAEPETASKPEAVKAQPSVEKQIEEVDEKIKKLEEKLEASKAKSDIPDTEANASAESNITFDQKLQEAIKSVQD